MALLKDRLLFAVGADGVAELQGSAFTVIKKTFHAVATTPGTNRVFFLRAEAEPCYVEYDPANTEAPWWRICL
jgi:hypothetical protein